MTRSRFNNQRTERNRMSAGAIYEIAAASEYHLHPHLHRGNRIPPPRETNRSKIAFRPETVAAETETQPQKPANCRLLGHLRDMTRLGRMRGGPGRTRTRYQTVMSRRINDWGSGTSRGARPSFPVQCGPGTATRPRHAMAVKVLPICSLRRRLLAYSQITY